MAPAAVDAVNTVHSDHPAPHEATAEFPKLRGVLPPGILNGKRVVVTGANRGLGLRLAHMLASAGADLIITSRDEGAGARAAAEVAQAAGRPVDSCCRVLPLDTSDASSVAAFTERLVKECSGGQGQGIDILVNNAGVRLEGWSREAYEACLATNFIGPLALTLGALPAMNPGGTVAMVGSGAGKLCLLKEPYQQQISSASTLEQLLSIPFAPHSAQAEVWSPAYHVSKALLHRASHLLAQDSRLAQRSLTINVVDPGWCATDMAPKQFMGRQVENTTDDGARRIAQVALAGLGLGPSARQQQQQDAGVNGVAEGRGEPGQLSGQRVSGQLYLAPMAAGEKGDVPCDWHSGLPL